MAVESPLRFFASPSRAFGKKETQNRKDRKVVAKIRKGKSSPRTDFAGAISVLNDWLPTGDDQYLGGKTHPTAFEIFGHTFFNRRFDGLYLIS